MPTWIAATMAPGGRGAWVRRWSEPQIPLSCPMKMANITDRFVGVPAILRATSSRVAAAEASQEEAAHASL
ncbi:MAG: hypothetical protein PVJ02_11130, partial [Gemmatimonadota bacterium]